MNSKSFVLLALFATAISAASCPPPLIIKSFANTVSTEGGDVTASVGTGYKLIGGGFSGQNLRTSYPASSTSWTVNTSPVTADVGPASVTAYAIGLYDPNNCWSVQQVKAGPFDKNTATGSGSAVCPAGSTLVGGGAQTDRFLNADYPDTVRGDSTSASQWTASFNSASGFPANTTTGLTVYALCLKPTGSGYTAGNFINNAGGTATSSRSDNRLQIVGGGFIVNGANGLATASYNNSAAWESHAAAGTSIQSLSIGLSVSSTSSSSTGSSTSAPTSAPTSASTSAPQKTCIGQIVTTPRSAANGGAWTSGSTTYQIYDIVVNNLGQCPITSANYDSVFTGPGNAGVSQKWNIGDSPSGDQILAAPLDLYGNAIPAGGSRAGFGVVVFNATGVTGVAHAPTTFCDASCTNA